MMFDTITAYAPFSETPFTGFMTLTNELGEKKWEDERWVDLEGAHGKQLRVQPHGEYLKVDGSYCAYLQGHNVFGTVDLISLCYMTFENVAAQRNLRVTEEDRERWRTGNYRVTRVDYAKSYNLGSSESVRNWLDAAGAVVNWKEVTIDRSKHGSTLYWQQHSKRHAMKFYGKGGELKAHRPASTLPCEKELREYAAPLLRIENTVKGQTLAALKMDRASAWTPETAEQLFEKHVGRLGLDAVMMRLAKAEVASLPPKLRPVYYAWVAGENMRSIYDARTFRKYREQLLTFGVDIAHQQLSIVQPETVYAGGLGASLMSFLKDSEVGPPDWAKGTSLLAG